MSSRWLLLVLVVALTSSACGGSGDDAAAPADDAVAEVAATYADIVVASYDASIASASAMQGAIDRFVARPGTASLRRARSAWLRARSDYTPTEAFRFYGGPIDDPQDGPEGLINAWPMDEAYVDYVAGDATAGIVNDRDGYPRITADVVVEANERGGETNISTGWHAIEFLLWGQDRSADGPGARPASDYASAPNAARRGTYLRLVTSRLLDDLRAVRARWDRAGGDFRAAFLDDPQRALRRIFRGIGALAVGELAGERMAVALESGDQEDEHSCFSDNTNADVVDDIEGIRRVYVASFAGVGGPSLNDLVEQADTGLAARLRTQIGDALAKAQAFPATFERMIAAPAGAAERAALEGVISDLEAIGETLGEAADRLGVEVGFEV